MNHWCGSLLLGGSGSLSGCKVGSGSHYFCPACILTRLPGHAECPRSLDPSFVSYCIKWVKTSWTYITEKVFVCNLPFYLKNGSLCPRDCHNPTRIRPLLWGWLKKKRRKTTYERSKCVLICRQCKKTSMYDLNYIKKMLLVIFFSIFISFDKIKALKKNSYSSQDCQPPSPLFYKQFSFCF